jgi:NAD-dependent dihydropyrimidine dehydrogenase PreA subunit
MNNIQPNFLTRSPDQAVLFARLMGMPLFMVPYVDLVVDPLEFELVLAIKDKALSAQEIAAGLELPMEATRHLLERAFGREVVNRETKNGITTYTVATFFRRMDVIATFENDVWARIPALIREAANHWYGEAYVDFWKPAIEQIREDPDRLPCRADYMLSNRDILLLDEAIAMVEAAHLHVMYPCGCLGIRRPDGKPLPEASIRLDEQAQLVLDRGQGRRVEKDEMIEIVRVATRAGRVITGLKTWREHAVLGLGLCCPDYSFSFTEGARVGLAKLWPRSHYYATLDMAACSHCADCVPHCPFGAFSVVKTATHQDSGSTGHVQYDLQRCWGCGLCVDVCPESAIRMEPLAVRQQ